MKYEIWIYEIWNMKYEIWIMKYELWNMKYEIWNMKNDILKSKNELLFIQGYEMKKEMNREIKPNEKRNEIKWPM